MADQLVHYASEFVVFRWFLSVMITVPAVCYCVAFVGLFHISLLYHLSVERKLTFSPNVGTL